MKISKKQSVKIKNLNILVTGGAGFIGSNLIKKLIENNRITIYDNFHRNSLKHSNFQNHPNLKIVSGDILDYKLLNKSIINQNIVIHLAAIAGVSSYYKNPLKTLEVDAFGTYNVLKSSSENKVKQVILFSTSEVYGTDANNVSEEDPTIIGPPTDSRWSYATGKLIGDHFAFAFSKMTGLNITIIRPFNIYGPGQVGEGAIQIFINQAIQNKNITINGSGKQKRSWCYIDDLIQGILLMIYNKKAYNQIFNIGNPNAYLCIEDLAKIVIKITKSKSKLIYKSNNFSEILDRKPNIEKIKKTLKFSTMLSIEKGIDRAYKWYKKI